MMNKNILKQLYDGEIYPAENIIGNANPELQKINERLAEEKAAFIKSLSEADRAKFQSVDDLNDESAALYGYECFAHGFKLAVSLMTESMSGAVGGAIGSVADGFKKAVSRDMVDGDMVDSDSG